MIYQSIHSPERFVLNTKNAGIRKAIELISFENLTRAERTQAKNKKANKIVIAKYRRLEALEIVKKCIAKNLEDDFIAEITGVGLQTIQEIRKDIKNKKEDV